MEDISENEELTGQTVDSCIKHRAWQSDVRPTEVIEFVSEGDATFHTEGTGGWSR